MSKKLEIKFSHIYEKMLNNPDEFVPKKAILMEVFVVDSENLHPRFIEYDTLYFDKNENNYCYYKLPKGKVLVLLLKTEFANSVMLWTTIRRYTPSKYKFYIDNRWQEFDIVIGGAGK